MTLLGGSKSQLFNSSVSSRKWEKGRAIGYLKYVIYRGYFELLNVKIYPCLTELCIVQRFLYFLVWNILVLKMFKLHFSVSLGYGLSPGVLHQIRHFGYLEVFRGAVPLVLCQYFRGHRHSERDRKDPGGCRHRANRDSRRDEPCKSQLRKCQGNIAIFEVAWQPKLQLRYMKRKSLISAFLG